MKINYNLNTLGHGGGVRVYFEVTNELVQRGHEVTITHNRKNAHADWFPVKSRLNKTSVPAKSLELLFHRFTRKGLASLFSRPVSNAPLLLFYTDEILREGIPECDINVATNWISTFPTYRSQKGIGFYHMLHYEVLLHPDPYLQPFVREAYSLPLSKIANSTWLKDTIKDEFGVEVPMVCPAIDHQVFYPRETRRKKNIKRVVCFGKSLEWKGFRDALKAMKIVFQEYKDVEWLVYGARPLDVCDPKVPYRFIRSPSDEELAELYSSADVVFCPSWYESFPLPPIEAMACGVPVVTTRLGTEDYAFHEENCLVVSSREPEMMAEAILMLLTDRKLSDKFKGAGLETAKRFTWKRTVDQLEKIFIGKLEGKER